MFDDPIPLPEGEDIASFDHEPSKHELMELMDSRNRDAMIVVFESQRLFYVRVVEPETAELLLNDPEKD